MVPVAMHSDRTKEIGETGSVVFYGVMLFVAFLEFCVVFWTWKCIKRALYPVGFSAALMQPKWKWGLRYPISLWWSFKFLSGALLILMFHAGVFHEGEPESTSQFGKSLVIVLFLSHLTFGNLMLALDSFVTREQLASVWKKRFVIELWVAGAASAIKWIAS